MMAATTQATAVRDDGLYEKSRLAKLRMPLTIAIFSMAIAAQVISGVKPAWPLTLSDPTTVSGLALLALGLAIRTWAAGMLNKKTRLATDGPYALVRHPLYLGSILMMIGFALLSGALWNLGVVAVTAALSFGSAIVDEERFLARHFADSWNAYAQSRGRLLPFSVAGDVTAAWSLRRWLQNREYNAVLLTLIGLAAILAWSQA
jgi:protein-S-isoprenylcysteine O-methyltransferase Ste14